MIEKRLNRLQTKINFFTQPIYGLLNRQTFICLGGPFGIFLMVKMFHALSGETKLKVNLILRGVGANKQVGLIYLFFTLEFLNEFF